LNESLEGITYPRRYLVGNVASKGAHRDDHFLSVAISSAGMLMAAELPHGRTLLVMDLPEGEISGEAPTLADFRQTMAAHLSKPFEIDDLRWSAMYRTHRRMAPKFSKGRCFLAGDAAHLCSPLGGEGMNSGFLDGASLAWMLAAVIRGDAKACLLDAYEPERQEIARQVLASSEAKHDFYYTLVAQAAEGKPLQPPAEDPTRKVTSPDMLDLATFESPILGFHGATQGIKAVRPGSRFSHRTQLNGCLHTLLVFGSSHGVDPTFFQRRGLNVLTFQPGDPICSAERAGVSTQGAVLIRPDGHVGYQMDCWSPESALALEEYLKAHFHPQGQG
jgi:hypothetical protein